jgi:hypothetical protein
MVDTHATDFVNVQKTPCVVQNIYPIRAPITFKLRGEVTSLSEGSQGEVGDNREKWGDFWEKLIAINRNIVSRPLLVNS